MTEEPGGNTDLSILKTQPYILPIQPKVHIRQATSYV